MNFITTFLLSFAMSFSAAHEFYLSVTDVTYVKEEESIQIISRVFVDDFENVLKKRYDQPIVLIEGREIEVTDQYIEKYIHQKFAIQIDQQEVNLNYLGREFVDDMVYLYIEIQNIKPFQEITIKDEILIDLFETQKNMIHFKSDQFKKSFILEKDIETRTLHIN